MTAPRADWTPTRHLRVLVRLLDDLIRQARDIRATYLNTPAQIETHAAPATLAILRAAIDALADSAERVRDAMFNYDHAMRDEQRHKRQK